MDCRGGVWGIQPFNPNWTGQGQRWPRQLWPQIAGKLIKYRTLHFFWDLFLQKRLPIFLKFWHDLKKWCFDVHFYVFSSEVGPRHCLPNTPPSTRFYCYYRSPEAGRSPAGQWSAVRCGASQIFSNQFPVAGRVECEGRQVLFSTSYFFFSFTFFSSSYFLRFYIGSPFGALSLTF